jgi:hypothetical protein
MKKAKTRPTSKTAVAAGNRDFPWWPVLGSLAAFVVVWVAYGPALHGPYVFDDQALPVLGPDAAYRSFTSWMSTNRPFWMFTFWLNYQVVNVLIHYATSVAVGLVVAKLLALAGTTGVKRTGLGVFGGALFLLHPVQTESVAYIVSRSEPLSVLFYFSAMALFLYRPEGPVSWPRTIGIALLTAAALSTKEHTVTLPALLLLTD